MLWLTAMTKVVTLRHVPSCLALLFRSLVLSNNQFQGTLPESLSALTQLWWDAVA